MFNLDSETFLKENEILTGHKATNEEKIRGIITDLKLLLNENETNRTLLEDLRDITEDLADLKNHPIHINQATKEDLERFPFLSDKLIENILY